MLQPSSSRWWRVQTSRQSASSVRISVTRISGGAARSKPRARSAASQASSAVSSAAGDACAPRQSTISTGMRAWRWTICIGAASWAAKPVRRMSWRGTAASNAARSRSTSGSTSVATSWFTYVARSGANSEWNSMPCCIGDSG
ncbi:Uncharacterised protein [Burkholderia pseudomallei]|nr:Uncharacterised protein [Burkholderia pseudomallei]